MEEFDGKVVVVTGGSSGLGAAVIKKFLVQGAKVAAISRGINKKDSTKFLKDSGAPIENLMIKKCDISIEGQVENTFNEILEKFGRIDILHANAAVCFNYCKMVDMTLERWQKIIDINLTGTFLTTKYAIRQMIKQNYGKVVITDSAWAFVYEPGYSNYIASKGGVLSYGRALALEYGPYNININIICPGNIYTPQLINSVDFERKDYEYMISKFGRISKPEEVADVVLFLSSDKSIAMKGSVVVIDNGASLKDGKGIVNIKH